MRATERRANHTRTRSAHEPSCSRTATVGRADRTTIVDKALPAQGIGSGRGGDQRARLGACRSSTSPTADIVNCDTILPGCERLPSARAPAVPVEPSQVALLRVWGPPTLRASGCVTATR